MEFLFSNNRNISATDIDGFKNLEQQIKSLEGKLIFLTSSGGESSKIVKNDFKKIGLNSDDYEIHYTAKVISKGQYVYNYINTIKFDEIIFIDDSYSNHLSIFSFFKKVNHYLFFTNIFE